MTTAWTPASCAARATPWAWLPAESVMTPAAGSAAVSAAILLSATRILKAPVFWRCSALAYSRPFPTRIPRAASTRAAVEDDRMGVRSIRPSRTRRASWNRSIGTMCSGMAEVWRQSVSVAGGSRSRRFVDQRQRRPSRCNLARRSNFDTGASAASTGAGSCASPVKVLTRLEPAALPWAAQRPAPGGWPEAYHSGTNRRAEAATRPPSRSGSNAGLHPVHEQLPGSLEQPGLPVRVSLQHLQQWLQERVPEEPSRHGRIDPERRQQRSRRPVLGRLQSRQCGPEHHPPRRPRQGPPEGLQRDHAALPPLREVQQLGGRDLLQ